MPATRSREQRHRKYTGEGSNSRRSSSLNSRCRISTSASVESSSGVKRIADELHAPPCIVDRRDRRPRSGPLAARQAVAAACPETPAVGMKPEPCGQLLGVLEVALQASRRDAPARWARCPGSAGPRPVSSVTVRFPVPMSASMPAAARRFACPRAGSDSARILVRRARWCTGPAADARSVALQLQRQHAVEFDGRGEQKRRCHGFSQEIANRGRDNPDARSAPARRRRDGPGARGSDSARTRIDAGSLGHAWVVGADGQLESPPASLSAAGNLP